jgi:hypothetical protein
MNKQNEKIVAAAALSRVLEIRQYSLEENYAHFVNMEAIHEINSLGKEKLGIDLLNYSGSINFADAERYEEFLDNIIELNLSNKYNDSFLQDELTLMGRAKHFSISAFSGFQIGQINALVKIAYKSVGLNVPAINSHIKDPYIVQVLDEEQLNFLVASKIEIKSKSVIALFHVSINRAAHMVSNPKTFDEISKNAVINGDIAPHVSSCFFFKNINPRFDSPIRMFLQAISRYGMNMTIGNVTKKFFLKGVSSSLLINKNNEINLQNELFGKSNKGIISIKQTYTGYEYEYAYTIDTDLLTRDYSRGNFM